MVFVVVPSFRNRRNANQLPTLCAQVDYLGREVAIKVGRILPQSEMLPGGGDPLLLLGSRRRSQESPALAS